MKGIRMRRQRLARWLYLVVLSAVLVVSQLAKPAAGTATPGIAEAGECTVPGTLCAWGAGRYGALGRGNENGSQTPLAVPGLTNVVKVAATSGLYTTSWAYALLADGTVWSWGYGADGQLGTGGSPRGGIPSSFVPQRIQALSSIVDIAAGSVEGFGYALRSDGTVWAWGYGYSGQLGNGFGSGAWSSTPIQINGLSNVIAIAAAQSTGFALLADGTVWSWGSAYRGILGNGTTGSAGKTYIPVRVSLPANIRAITAGSQNAYALGADGTVWAWGNNNWGGLGNSSATQDALYPVSVGALSGVNVVAIAASNSNTGTAYALGDDGIVRAWGYGKEGQLGNGIMGNQNGQPYHSGNPVQVSNLNDVVSIGAAAGNGYAVRANGTVMAWGWGRQGVIGNGTTSNSAVPVIVSGLTNATVVDGGLAAYAVVGGLNLHTYVALGDSFSSGEGNPPYGAGSSDQACHRSPAAWPSLVATGSPTATTLKVNIACSGAKASDALSVSYRGEAPQLVAMAAFNPKLVTITIGGNDLGFSGMILRCVLINCDEDVLLKIAEILDYIDEARSIFEQVKAAAPQDARIVAVGYPRLFPIVQSVTSGCGWLTPNERNYLNAAAAALDDVLSQAASQAGIEYASTLETLDGHELCREDSWMNPVVAGSNGEAAHPNTQGQQALAATVNHWLNS